MKLGKMSFISLQKLFSFSRKSDFRIIHFKISWRYHMPRHKTRNTFHWVTWEVNSLLIKFGQFISYYKRKKFIKKLYKNCVLKTSSTLCLQRIKHNLYWKMKFLKQATYIRYVRGKLSNSAQISMTFGFTLT